MTMRSFLHFLTLVALLFAPLAAPAVAMAPAPLAAACQDMGMGSTDHEMPAGTHDNGGSCCLAVCAAIAMPPVAANRVEPVGLLSFQSMSEAFRLGAGPSTDDPPPRRA